jgi:ribonuclease T2
LLLLLCSCGGPTVSPSRGDRIETSAQESGSGHHRHRHRGPRGGQAARLSGGAEAGKFDFYVLSLSWSPGFCATAAGRNDPLQCGSDRHFAFVLHGWWPQYEQSGWPENCSTEPADENLIDSMLTIMPSRQLVAHEWEKHGTCSGLSPKEYFEEATEAFHGVNIPPRYQSPPSPILVNPDQLRHDFAAANPKIGEQGFVVLCSRNGRYLQEVRACLTPDLEGRPCNAEVQREACQSSQIVMRPLR